jgi:hypothetical protein
MIPAILSPSSRRRTAHDGFALVIALSLMAFVLLLLLSITTLVQVETQSAEIASAQVEAEQAALLGLQMALGELQKAAGPDQRVTATAEILNDSNSLYTPGGTTPKEGQGSWSGVWKSDTVSTGTPSYSPADPNQREFIGWLVSSANAAGELELPTTLDAIESTPLNSVTLAKDSSGNAYATVGKVEVDSTNRNQIAYAFMVEDESVKADLSWSEHSTSATSAERYQAGRLAAAPGPDYGALNGSSATGPFDSVTYPLSSDSTTLISDGILKLSDVASITSMMSSGADASDWLRDSRGDVTWGSRGVMADVKFGGLRRDLSLAFEMDGDADMISAAIGQPTKFNQQVDEFVADVPDKDRLSASGKPDGLPVYERFVYRDYKDASPATPFSSNIVSNSSEVRKRGPNWWALRDYANLYKRLSGTSGNYTLQARPHYPNVITEGRNYSEMFDTIHSFADQWDHEQRERSQGGTFSGYIYRPAKPSYAPVTLGTTALLSLKGIPVGAGEVQLAVAIDPIFYIWNPYNRKLQFEGLKIDLKNSFPGRVNIKIEGTDGQTISSYVRDLFQWNVNAQNWRKFAFEVQDAAGSTTITMEPGEVMAVSPSTANSGIAKPGYFEDGDINNSGIVMTKLKNNSTVLIDATLDANEVSFGYSSAETKSTSRFYLNTGISNPTDPSITEEIQQSHYQIGAGASGGYSTPDSDDEDFIIAGSEFDANLLLDGEKKFFGLFMHLMKPALFGGGSGGLVDTVANPVEVFSRFNPAPMLMNKDFGFTGCGINQFFGHISDDNFNNLTNNYGFNFTGSGRNAFWGATYQSGGSTSVPMSNIPSSPLISLAEFSHANLSTLAAEPFHAVGNSWSSPFVTPTSPYQAVYVGSISQWTAGDHSWLMNDALFDRYYLSGIAPQFTLSGGYSDGGNTLKDTLDKFFDNDTDPSTDYRDALANPVLRPYLPPGKLANDVVSELDAADGYKKMGAYSLIDGAFNVNSTSIPAWEAFLRSNRSLAVRYAQGSATDSPSNDTPFPSSVSPSDPSAPGSLTTQAHWAGLARLDDGDITDLATRIVEQVTLRGPFMSLSDFVNHRMGALNNATSYAGALQAAIDLSTINNTVQGNAGGATPDYSSSYIPGRPPTSTLKQSTTGIPGDLTQADLLLPLAPRLTARSDTFRIRSYGEVRSLDGNSIVSRAICEAIVQRVPEYVDPLTNADDNEPWDEAINPVTLAQSSKFNDINKTFGRRFRVVQLRWLSPDEI